MPAEHLLTDHLPLTETTFMILLSLATGPKHGYAIMKDVTALSDERLSLGTGTLYGALSRLLDQGWVEHIPPAPGEKVSRSRKDYDLTTLGRRILLAETERLQALLYSAQLRLVEGDA